MIPVRFYLAARYSRREELCAYRSTLAAHGAVVTSRWLNGNHQIDDRGVPIGDSGATLVEADPGTAEADARAAELRAHFASEDLRDVECADVVVAFTEEPRVAASRGGRHVELGLALALRKQVVVVGPRENVFTWLPTVEHYPSWQSALSRLTVLARNGLHR